MPPPRRSPPRSRLSRQPRDSPFDRYRLGDGADLLMRQLAALRERVDLLEEENRQLRTAYLPHTGRFGCLPLSPSECLLVAALVDTQKGSTCTTEYLANCLAIANRHSNPIQDRTVSVYVCNIRKKIAPLTIRTAWGTGYYFDEDTKTQLRAMREGTNMKMHTTVHYELDLPHATPEQMHQAEALMRDPDYIAAVLAATNAIATLHARKAGMMDPIHITGTIHAVEHK
jgi:hypothetical protein